MGLAPAIHDPREPSRDRRPRWASQSIVALVSIAVRVVTQLRLGDLCGQLATRKVRRLPRRTLTVNQKIEGQLR